jgi:hypothetical protein
MAMGLQDLIMFRDNLQQPEMTGMDNLRNLQALTMQGMANEDYTNAAFGGMVNNIMMTPQEYLASGGIVGLPVVQAGFGGFLKKITSIPRKIVKTVKRVAKSPIGQLAIAAAPMVFGLPPVFSNPALNAAFYSGTGSLLTGAKPKDALKTAILSGTLTGATQGFRTPAGSEKYAASAGERASQLKDAAASGIPKPPAETSFFKDLARGITDSAYDPEGTVLSRLGERLANTGQFKDTSLLQELGIQPTGTAEGLAKESLEKTDQSMLDKGMQFLGDNKGKIAAGIGLASLSSGGPQIQEMSQYTPQQLSDADVGFDTQRAFYFDTKTNQPLTIAEALSRMQTASQSFGEGGERQASGVSLGFEDVDDTVLSSSGGLIGMAYGGSMPMNNMDVKYKEFSGMVEGRGSGMEDNVYMPIVEGEQGQQVATLAVSPKEYVVDANTMSLLGNGNPDEGAEIMDETVKDIRMAATGQKKQQKEIDGLAALNRMRRSV